MGAKMLTPMDCARIADIMLIEAKKKAARKTVR